MMSSYVTMDLGATSGRVVLGRLERGRLDVAEVHRFRNEPSGSGRKQHWNAESSLHRPLSAYDVLPLSWTVPPAA